MPIEKLPKIEFSKQGAEEIGDKLAAEIFIIGASWHPGKIVYPSADAWVGLNLLGVHGELGKMSKFLNASKRP